MSSEYAEETVNPSSAGILRPPVPEPTASNTVVHRFLVQFFRALKYDRTLREAEMMADQLNIDEQALYELSVDKLTEEFGYEGMTIYNALQRSKYGYNGGYWPLLEVVRGTLLFTGTFEGVLGFWWQKDARTFMFPIFCTISILLLSILKLYYRSNAAIESNWIPDGLKIRCGWFK